jgi:subtilisin family serine protease
VLAGINFVGTDSKSRTAICPNGFVATMSLGGGRSTSVNAAVATIYNAGILPVVAAGNEGINGTFTIQHPLQNPPTN